MIKKTKKQDKDASNANSKAVKNTKDELQAELEQAQQSVKNNWDKVLRLQAEIQNLKRRHSKDLEDAHKFVLNGFAKELLAVNDSLLFGLKSAAEKNVTAEHITEGLEMTNKIFLSTLAKFGVEKVDPVNQTFDPELHEAVTMVAAADQPTNTVLEVVQVGFTLNNRLLRPARVVVVQ